MAKRSSDLTQVTVGWDSEFCTENDPEPHQVVISHQLYVLEDRQPDFIDCLKRGPVTFRGLIERVRRYHPKLKTLNLVAHFSRAELSAITDGRQLLQSEGARCIQSSGTISGTFHVDGLTVHLFDTFQYMPKSLEDLADLIGEKKIDIGEFRSDQKIRQLYDENFPLFKKYALNDARITAKLFDRLRNFFLKELGLKRMPSTIGAVGAKLLAKRLKANPKRAEGLGYRCQGPLATEVGNPYHGKVLLPLSGDLERRFRGVLYGARNELYVRGMYPDVPVFDYDLISAYVTAQTTIGEFDFSSSMRFNDPADCYDYLRHNPFSFGTCEAGKWEHQDCVKYPAIVQKTDKCTIFISEAVRYTITSHEFLAAYPTMKTIQDFEATIYPRVKETSIVSEFHTEIYGKRQVAKQGVDGFDKQLLKDVGNTTFGKTCQGYAARRSIDFENSGNGVIVRKPIPTSVISNPFLAAYITSMIRAVAFETLNELDRRGTPVLYWTTDGGAIQEPLPEDIRRGEFGVLTRAIGDHVEKMVGKRELFELKNHGIGWLGIKTRGYTMLEKIDKCSILSAFTGIHDPDRKRNIPRRIAFLRREFEELTRFKDTRYRHSGPISLRAWLLGEEYRTIETTRAYNWDFDLKRDVDVTSIRMDQGKLQFDTIPHRCDKDFDFVRGCYRDFHRGHRDAVTNSQTRLKNKIITADDFREFLDYVNERRLLAVEKGYGQRANGFLHLKVLANYLRFRSYNKPGYRRIAKMLNLSSDTVKPWILTEVPINNPRDLMHFLVEKFHLGCPMIYNSLKFTAHPKDHQIEMAQRFETWDMHETFGFEVFFQLVIFLGHLHSLSSSETSTVAPVLSDDVHGTVSPAFAAVDDTASIPSVGVPLPVALDPTVIETVRPNAP